MTLFLRPYSSATSPSTLTPQVLRDWLHAITAFQASYHQLSQHRLNNKLGDPLLKPCLNGQVNQLLEQMSHELNALLNELTHLSDSVSLARHTARLRLLTNQAIIITGLLTPSNG